jgi:hypothetical protein
VFSGENDVFSGAWLLRTPSLLQRSDADGAGAAEVLSAQATVRKRM